jgi:TolA-binding protein
MSFRSFVYSVTLVVSLFATAGCLQTRSETAEQDEKKQVMNQVSNLQKVKADQGAKIDELTETIRSLSGRIETMEARHEKTIEQYNQQVAESKAQNKAQNEEFVVQLKMFEQDIAALKEKAAQAEAARVAAVNEAQNAKANSAKASEAANAKPAEKNAAEKASWEEAEELFEKKDYKRAATALQRYREKNPKGKRLGEATYRIGVCFQEMGMKSEAKAFYSEVLERFAKDPAAKKATFRLSQLKK